MVVKAKPPHSACKFGLPRFTGYNKTVPACLCSILGPGGNKIPHLPVNLVVAGLPWLAGHRETLTSYVGYLVIIKAFIKHKIVSIETVRNAYTYTHTHIHTRAPAHTSILTIQNLIYAQLKTGSKQRLETHEDSSTEWKTWQVYWAVQWSWFAQVNALCNLSRKKSRFLRRRCFMLCKTMEVQPRIVKQYKRHHCCKNYWGKGMEGGERVSLCRFLADQKIASSWKKIVLGHPIARATSYCLLPDTFWLRASKNAFKVGSVRFANSLSPPSIVRKVLTGSKSGQGT